MVVVLEGSPISTWELWSSVQSDHQVIGHLLAQGHSPPIVQFGRMASSRKSLGGSKLFPFKNNGSHCIIGDLQCYRHFFGVLPQICASTQSCLGPLRTISSTSWPGVCSDMH